MVNRETEAWNEFVRRGRAYLNTGRLESQEINYKVEISQKLAMARDAVLAGSAYWPNLIKRGLVGNLIFRIPQSQFRRWIDNSPDAAIQALRAIWTQRDLPVADRIRAFCDLFPESVIRGAGTRMNVASVLLMGLDVEQYPPFRITKFDRAYERAGYVPRERNADEATLYDHALNFLDRFIQEASERGVDLRHRLDAQSVVWIVVPDHDESWVTAPDSEVRVSSQQDPNPWDSFVRRASEYVHANPLEGNVNDYRLEVGRRLSEARQAVLDGADDWNSRLVSVLPNKSSLRVRSAPKREFREWLNTFPQKPPEAVQMIWTKEETSDSERVSQFLSLLADDAITGTAGRIHIASVLMMGLDVRLYPPYREKVFSEAYSATEYPSPGKNADEASIYQHALGFLDRFIEEADQHGLNLRHRLDAHTVVSAIYHEPYPLTPDIPEAETEPDLHSLAKEMTLPVSFLEEIETLLEDKKQVIFQGPPGTGKTYVAQKLARHLAGSEDQVTLVQFHPSYSYEDFVQGFRPTILDSGQPGFKLTDGPLLRAAKSAMDTDAKHFLIIDEINRGNLARILGELYFLLEYREEEISLQYQGDTEEKFSLPDNLYIIGTMNTADRSIALVDLALRRRFYFVEFHPDDEPVKSVLRNWLNAKAPGMEWVADLVDAANEKLRDDRHAAIGPSYFIKDGLDETAVELIWKHSVLPYIEERLFGEGEERIREFDLDVLRGTDVADPQEDGEE